MSLGDTDKTWWKLLGNWLKGDDRRLVIFGHNDDYSQIGYTHPRQFALQDDLIDRFLDLAEIQDAVRDDLSNKIFAIINPNLFNINLVKMTAQKKKEENKPEFHNGFDDENDLSFIDIQNLLQYKQAQIQEANDLELQFAKDSPLFENAMTDYQNILNMFPQSLIDEAKEWKKTHHEQL